MQKNLKQRLNQSVLLLISCIIGSSSYAEGCPTVHQIKNHKLISWKAFDSEDHKPLTPERVLKFKNAIKEFVLAEWKTTTSGSAMHCFYRDNNGSNLEAYLSKANLAPEKTSQFWYVVSGAKQCAAGMANCQFYSDATTSLAEK